MTTSTQNTSISCKNLVNVGLAPHDEQTGYKIFNLKPPVTATWRMLVIWHGCQDAQGAEGNEWADMSAKERSLHYRSEADIDTHQHEISTEAIAAINLAVRRKNLSRCRKANQPVLLTGIHEKC